MPVTGKRYDFTKTNVDRAPLDHGVYVLFVGNETIYIGRASGTGVTLRSRLQEHQRGDEGPCTKQAATYSRESHEDAAARELELYREHVATHGRPPRCNDRVPPGR